MFSRGWVSGFVLLAAVVTAVPRDAMAGGGDGAVQRGQPCVQYVHKTVMVPEWVTEMRRVLVTEYRHEVRERPYTTYRSVPETKPVTRTYTVMVPEQRSKTIDYTVHRPVPRQVTRDYQVSVPEWSEKQVEVTVMVPHQEMRQGVRRVCQMVTEEVVQPITRDCGYWDTCVVQVPCGCSHGCCHHRTVCKKVWVPNLVTEEVTTTVCRPQVFEEPYEYSVTVCRPEVQTRTVRVCNWRTETRQTSYTVTDYLPETKSREITYTVCVPQQVTRDEQVTVMRTVAEQRVAQYTVCVPVQVEKDVQVRVCRMVPRTIQVPVCDIGCGPGGCY